MVKVLDKDSCEYDKKYTCYDCKYWRVVDPKCGGLIDVAVCARRLLEVYENMDICVDFKEMNNRDRAAQNLVRRKMLEATNRMKKETEKYSKKRMKEEVVDDILETIKWNIMRSIDD